MKSKKQAETRAAQMLADPKQIARNMLTLNRGNFANAARHVTAIGAMKDRMASHSNVAVAMAGQKITSPSGRFAQKRLAQAMRRMARAGEMQTPDVGDKEVGISGQVSQSGEGVEAAVVTLVDAKDVALWQGRTDRQGNFATTVPASSTRDGARIIIADAAGQQLHADTKMRSLAAGKLSFALIDADPAKAGNRFRARPDQRSKVKSMPDLVGQPIADAVRRLEEAGIPMAGVQVVTARKGTGGDVTSMQPAAGNLVPEGTRAKLNVGATKDLQFRRPTVAAIVAANSGGALHLEEVEKALERAGDNGFSGLEGARKLIDADDKSFAKATGLDRNAPLMREELTQLIQRFENYRKD